MHSAQSLDSSLMSLQSVYPLHRSLSRMHRPLLHAKYPGGHISVSATRMHSSRMRTVHLLTVYHHALPRGVPGGGVPAGGVPAQEGTCPRRYLPGGYLPGGCTCPGGCTRPGGVYLLRGVGWGGTCPATPPLEQND